MKRLYLLGAVLTLITFPSLWAQEKAGYSDIVDTLTENLPGRVGGVTVDRVGFIYVADFGEQVWKVSPQGEVTVFADSMYGSSGNTIDSRGRLLQANFYGNYIARVSRSGEVSVLVDEGLSGPVGITVDPKDDMYVCNCGDNTIGKYSPDGKGAVFAKSDLLKCPNGITLVGQDLYVVNFSDDAVMKITSDGQVSELARLPGNGNGHITFARGALYATSFRGHKIYKVGLGGQVTELAGTGQKGTVDGAGNLARFSHPNGIAASPTGNRLYVNDFLGISGVVSDDPPRSVLRRIKLASLTDLFTNTLNIQGLEAAIVAFKDYKANTTVFTEVETNILGYRLMNTGQMDAALAVFQLNVAFYPKSFNAYDSLAEGFKKKGDKEKAVKFYKKSLELNPNNTNAVTMLKDLQGS